MAPVQHLFRQEHPSISKATRPTPNFPPNIFFLTSINCTEFWLSIQFAHHLFCSSFVILKRLFALSFLTTPDPPVQPSIALSGLCWWLVSLLHWISSPSRAETKSVLLSGLSAAPWKGLTESRYSIHTYWRSVYFYTSNLLTLTQSEFPVPECSQALHLLWWEHPFRQREVGLISHPTCAGQSDLCWSLEGVTVLLGISNDLLQFTPCACWTFSILRLPAGHHPSLILTQSISSQSPICRDMTI